jgi:hypothetical protein
VNVTRNVTSENVMMADDGMENVRTEGFVFRFKMPFERFRVGGVGSLWAEEIHKPLSRIISVPAGFRAGHVPNSSHVFYSLHYTQTHKRVILGLYMHEGV